MRIGKRNLVSLMLLVLPASLLWSAITVNLPPVPADEFWQAGNEYSLVDTRFLNKQGQHDSYTYTYNQLLSYSIIYEEGISATISAWLSYRANYDSISMADWASQLRTVPLVRVPTVPANTYWQSGTTYKISDVRYRNSRGFYDIYYYTYDELLSFSIIYEEDISDTISAWLAYRANHGNISISISDWANQLHSIQPGQIVITEFMQDPTKVADTAGEWVELYNNTANPIDISGCIIKDDGSNTHTITNGTEPIFIQPGGYYVLGKNSDPAVNGGLTVNHVYGSYSLGNTSDQIVLVNPQGAEIDRVNYGAGWPLAAGKSLELNNAGDDNNNSSNWHQSTASYGLGDMGTPGAVNSPQANEIIDVTMPPVPLSEFFQPDNSYRFFGTYVYTYDQIFAFSIQYEHSIEDTLSEWLRMRGHFGDLSLEQAFSGLYHTVYLPPVPLNENWLQNHTYELIASPNAYVYTYQQLFNFSVTYEEDISDTIAAWLSYRAGHGSISLEDWANQLHSIQPGQIVINEFIADPSASNDTYGEWIELKNVTAGDIDINGCVLKDDGSNSHTINNGGPLVIPSGAHFVLGKSTDAALNGNIYIHYKYGSAFSMTNTADQIVLVSPEGVEIDRVNYDKAQGWPIEAGHSCELNASDLDNSNPASWHSATYTFGAGDRGTPGDVNSPAEDNNIAVAFTGTITRTYAGYKAVLYDWSNPDNPTMLAEQIFTADASDVNYNLSCNVLQPGGPRLALTIKKVSGYMDKMYYAECLPPATADFWAEPNLALIVYQNADLTAGTYSSNNFIAEGTEPMSECHITAPLNNATVNGVVTITAVCNSSSDMTTARIMVDEHVIPSTVDPANRTVTASWNTAAVVNGTHKVQATVANFNDDGAEAYLDEITVTVNNPTGPSDLSPSDIVSIPDNPGVTMVAPGGNPSSIESTRRGVAFLYHTGPTGWAGCGFSYDDFMTQEIETGDFSGVSQLVFGIKGDISGVKLELVDDQDRKSLVYLAGINAGEQVYVIPVNILAGAADLNKIRLIYFIVEGANLEGTLEVNRLSPENQLPPEEIEVSELIPSEIVSIPGNPGATMVAPAGNSSIVEATRRGVLLQYGTGQGGWAGCGFSYDDFMTQEQETCDLSGVSELVFGVKGTDSQVKFELLDDQDRKYTVKLIGVGGMNEQVYVISSRYINEKADLSRVRLIYFIVEGANLTGTLEVNRLSPENQLPPSAIGPSELNPEEIAAIPGNPTLTIVQMPGNMSTFTGTSRGLILNYQTNSEGWVGSGFSYDNFITSEVETCDLSGAAELMFGLKGSPSSVKLELVDELNRKFSIRLTGLRQNSEQVYAIPSEYLNAGSADLSRTRLIYFIVEGENLTGTLEVSRFPYELQAPLLNVSAVDSDGNYTVSWNRITGAAVYQIQEDTVATFGSVSFREFWTTLPLEEITGKSPGTYLYRVKAWSARPEESGRAGSWSEVKSVQVVSAGRPHSSFISPSKPLQFGEEVQKISIYNAQGRKISEVEGNVWYGTPANTPGDTSNSLRSGPYIFKTKTKSGEEVYGTIIMIK